MLSELRHRLRKARDGVRDHLERGDRFVDFGVLLRVVEPAQKGEPGAIQPLRGKPWVRVVDEYQLGGMVDTAARPAEFCGPSENPIVWYTDRVSAPLILHANDLPPNILCEGAMGVGKSTTLAQWCAVRCIEATGVEGELGVTAATGARMGEVTRACFDLYPPSWYRWKERDQVMFLRNATSMRFISTHKASKAEGSRIQAWNWFASANDELQDSIDEDGNIEARGRDAPFGTVYKRFASATVKDSAEYRTWKQRSAQMLTEDTHERIWAHVRKRGLDSPFQTAAWWARLKGSLTHNEYLRKVECVDVPSDKRVYYAFDRRENMRPRPIIGGRDITMRELERWGRSFQVLGGHDPGRIYDVTTLLQAWQVHGIDDPVWWVIGEVTTRRSTTQHHVRAVRDFLAKRYSIAPQNVHVNGDPHTRGPNDEEQPHVTVAKVWRAHGFSYSPAAYKPNSTEPAQVPREARLDMVNTLFCSADDIRRLMLDCNDRGDCAAPDLLKSLEELEIDAAGKAERDKKDETDRTHWPASVGYALWPIESVRIAERRTA